MAQSSSWGGGDVGDVARRGDGGAAAAPGGTSSSCWRAAPASQTPLTLSGCFIKGDQAFQIQMIRLCSKYLSAHAVVWTLGGEMNALIAQSLEGGNTGREITNLTHFSWCSHEAVLLNGRTNFL